MAFNILLELLRTGMDYGQAQDLIRRQEEFNEGQQERFDEFGNRIGQIGNANIGRVGGLAADLGRSNQPFTFQNAGALYRLNLGTQQGQNINQGFADRTALGATQGEAIVGGFQDRFQRGLANLRGAGLQESRDIDRRFNNLGGRQDQDLIDRGLTGSTIRPTLKAGLARDRTSEQGRLQERLRRERLETDARLSGDFLNAQTGQQAFQAGLSGQQLGGLQGQQGFSAGLSANQLAAMQGGLGFQSQLGQQGFQNQAFAGQLVPNQQELNLQNMFQREELRTDEFPIR